MKIVVDTYNKIMNTVQFPTKAAAELYLAGQSTLSIGKIFGVSYATVRNRLKIYGIKLRSAGAALNNSNGRKHTFDEHYFESVDSESKAYFLGLIAADGGVSDRGSLRLGLIEEDAYLVERFREEIGTTDYCRYAPKRAHRRPFVYLNVCSKKLVSDLSKLGILPRKSLSMGFPKNTKVLFSHFVRGYFDGDGDFRREKKGYRYLLARICGTKAFLWGLLKRLQSEDVVRSGSIRPHGRIHRLSFSPKNTETFADWLYRDATIFMHRKKELT